MKGKNGLGMNNQKPNYLCLKREVRKRERII